MLPQRKMWPFSASGGLTRVKICSASNGTGLFLTHSPWTLPNKSTSVSFCLIKLSPPICYFIMWILKFGLKKLSKCIFHKVFFPALLSCAIWSCAMLDCFSTLFLITFYTRGSSSISQFTVASWYVVLDTPVVATGGYNVPVVATRGFLDPPGRCYRRILSSCSYY